VLPLAHGFENEVSHSPISHLSLHRGPIRPETFLCLFLYSGLKMNRWAEASCPDPSGYAISFPRALDAVTCPREQGSSRCSCPWSSCLSTNKDVSPPLRIPHSFSLPVFCLCFVFFSIVWLFLKYLCSSDGFLNIPAPSCQPPQGQHTCSAFQRVKFV